MPPALQPAGTVEKVQEPTVTALLYAMKRTITFTASSLIIASCLIGFASDAAHAAPMTFTVDTLGDNPADGDTLREALADADANPGPDTIDFAAGLAGTLTLGSSLSSAGSVTINGPAGGGITIDAGGNSRILNSFFPGADLTIRNLTLTGGDAPFQGAAVAVYQGNDVMIESVDFIDNTTAGDGGALSVGAISGTATISDSSFTDNTAAGDGGALHVFDHDDGEGIIIERTTFERNVSTSGSGGAVAAHAAGAQISLRMVDVDANRAVTGDAGGLDLRAGGIQMSDVAITNNVAGDDQGGADLRSTSANINLERLEISGNEAASEVGGAAIRSASVVNLSDSRIHSNSAASTAGLRVQGAERVNVRRSVVESNEATAVVGGIAVISTPRVEIEESTIRNNRAPEIGGLYLANNDQSFVLFSTISGNESAAGDAGGVFATGAPTDIVRLLNSTVSGNSASGRGGGVVADDLELIVGSSTVVENSAGILGGGIFQAGLAESSIFRSIVATNDAPALETVNGPVSAAEWSLLGDTTGAILVSVSNNLDPADPMLGPLQNNGGPTATHLPSASSPVVDADEPVLVVFSQSRDQRGFFRSVGTASDLGAVERSSGNGAIWTPVQPARIVDTRDSGITIDGRDQGQGRLVAGSQTIIDVGGRASVPDSAKGVVANITAVQPAGRGYFTAHPCADDVPLAASLNYTAGVNLGNEIIIGLEEGVGALCLFTSASTHVTIDVVGYVGSRSPYEPTEPARFLDTRANGTTVDGESQSIGRIGAGDTVQVNIRNRGDIDIDARTATLYVTAIRPERAGFLTIWNCDLDMPLASSLNYAADVNRGNEVVINTDPRESNICIFSSRSVDLTVDVVGFTPELPNNYRSLDAPARLLDSRTAEPTVDGEFEGGGPRPAGSILELQIAGRAGISEDATTVALNLTAVRPVGVGYVTAFPCGGAPPLASSLNHVGGVNGGNEIIASLDDQGRLCLFTFTETHLTADITGFTTV